MKRIRPYFISSIFGILFSLSSVPSYSEHASYPDLNADPHYRTLTASCAACHGTLGNAQPAVKQKDMSLPPSLAGIKEEAFINKMKGFKDSAQISSVMVRHAKGLTPEEIETLAHYFSSLKPASPAKLVNKQWEALDE